jgi:excisionase family DNA binding protein
MNWNSETLVAMRLLTTSEAAEYLRLKERKLYELVAENAVPCTKVTGKWLFPKDELDRWLRGSLVRPDGMVRTDPMPIVGGTPDLLLEWSLLESASGLAMLPEGAEPGLRRFIRGELVASAINLQATDDDLDANINMMQSEANLHDAVLIGFSKREVGLVVASGNPLGLASVTDIPIKAARIAAQPDGSGPQILLERLLKRADVALSQVTFASAVCPTGPDVAQAVRLGRADCGFAIRAIANAIGLSFIPIAWERFDLVVRQHDYFRPQLQTFLRFLKSPALAARASEMGGYDISGIGEVRFAP